MNEKTPQNNASVNKYKIKKVLKRCSNDSNKNQRNKGSIHAAHSVHHWTMTREFVARSTYVHFLYLAQMDTIQSTFDHIPYTIDSLIIIAILRVTVVLFPCQEHV